VVQVDEEVVLLEEQLLAAQADIERLQGRLAEAEALATSRNGDLSELRHRFEAVNAALAARDADVEAQSDVVATLQSRLEDLGARSQADAARYRSLVLAHEPELPADLVQGESVDAIEDSLLQARQTVAQVRQHIEHQAQSLRVPTGAPVRSAPATADLSPSEKIRLGLSTK
jgi:hypothetical protein